MEFTWQSITFCVENERIYIKKFADVAKNKTCSPIVELQLGGRDHPSNVGGKAVRCSESESLRYVSHGIHENTLMVTQANDRCEVTTEFRAYKDTNAVRIFSCVKNVSAAPITVEILSAFVLGGLFGGRKNADKTYFTKFTQGHHCECQPRRFSLEQYGFNAYIDGGEKCLTYKNIGSWSSKEQLPQGILEYENEFLMFQIESNSHWQYTLRRKKANSFCALAARARFAATRAKSCCRTRACARLPLRLRAAIRSMLS
jgi:hypothetical protein